MKATIIINTNNQNAFLRRAIHSAINQEYSNYEVIISNLSKKKDFNIEKEFKNNKKIKFLNLNERCPHPTQNQLYAIKEALKYSNGQYIFLLDGDDYFKKEIVIISPKNDIFVPYHPLKNRFFSCLTPARIFIGLS